MTHLSTSIQFSENMNEYAIQSKFITIHIVEQNVNYCIELKLKKALTTRRIKFILLMAGFQLSTTNKSTISNSKMTVAPLEEVLRSPL